MTEQSEGCCGADDSSDAFASAPFVGTEHAVHNVRAKAVVASRGVRASVATELPFGSEPTTAPGGRGESTMVDACWRAMRGRLPTPSRAPGVTPGPARQRVRALGGECSRAQKQ